MRVVNATMMCLPLLGKKTGVATQIKALNSKCLYMRWTIAQIGKVQKRLLWDCKRDLEACEKVAPEKHEVG